MSSGFFSHKNMFWIHKIRTAGFIAISTSPSRATLHSEEGLKNTFPLISHYVSITDFMFAEWMNEWNNCRSGHPIISLYTVFDAPFRRWEQTSVFPTDTTCAVLNMQRTMVSFISLRNAWWLSISVLWQPPVTQMILARRKPMVLVLLSQTDFHEEFKRTWEKTQN